MNPLRVCAAYLLRSCTAFARLDAMGQQLTFIKKPE